MDKNYYIGIDIAKAKFDMAFFKENGKASTKIFENNSKGFKALDAFLKEKGIKQANITMESTNIYWEDLAFHLHKKKNIVVSVVNPLRVSAYAKAQLSRLKTDKADAKLLARFCEKETPPEWKPPSKANRELLKMVRQCEYLKKSLQREKTRYRTADKVVKSSIKATINFYAKQIVAMQKKIKDHIKKDAELWEGYKLLLTIPNIGVNTAPWLLAVLENGERFDNVKQVACYLGLTPRHFESGSSVKGKTPISKIGPSDMRKILYMPAVGASYGKHKNLQGFVKRLEDSGKTKMTVIVAMMRKLATIAQAVLKTRMPYNPALQAG